MVTRGWKWKWKLTNFWDVTSTFGRCLLIPLLNPEDGHFFVTFSSRKCLEKLISLQDLNLTCFSLWVWNSVSLITGLRHSEMKVLTETLWDREKLSNKRAGKFFVMCKFHKLSLKYLNKRRQKKHQVVEKTHVIFWCKNSREESTCWLQKRSYLSFGFQASTLL
jgi:hypothetical protein